MSNQRNANLLQRPLLRALPVLAWMGVIFALSSRHQIPQPPGVSFDLSTLGHFTVYAILAALTWWALGGTSLSSRRRVALAFTIAVLYGVSDEWHQSFVPGRHPDPMDIAVDALGAACGIVAVSWMARRWPTLPVWPRPTPADPAEAA